MILLANSENLTPQPPSHPSRSPLQGEMAEDEAFYFTEGGTKLASGL